MIQRLKKVGKMRMRKDTLFWGLGGSNIKEIREVERKGEEWWYVDVGYIDRTNH